MVGNFRQKYLEMVRVIPECSVPPLKRFKNFRRIMQSSKRIHYNGNADEPNHLWVGRFMSDKDGQDY